MVSDITLTSLVMAIQNKTIKAKSDYQNKIKNQTKHYQTDSKSKSEAVSNKLLVLLKFFWWRSIPESELLKYENDEWFDSYETQTNDFLEINEQ